MLTPPVGEAAGRPSWTLPCTASGRCSLRPGERRCKCQQLSAPIHSTWRGPATTLQSEFVISWTAPQFTFARGRRRSSRTCRMPFGLWCLTSVRAMVGNPSATRRAWRMLLQPHPRFGRLPKRGSCTHMSTCCCRDTLQAHMCLLRLATRSCEVWRGRQLPCRV